MSPGCGWQFFDSENDWEKFAPNKVLSRAFTRRKCGNDHRSFWSADEGQVNDICQFPQGRQSTIKKSVKQVE